MNLYAKPFEDAAVQLTLTERAIQRTIDIEHREGLLRGTDPTYRHEADALKRQLWADCACLAQFIAWAEAQQIWGDLPDELRGRIARAARGGRA